MSLFFPVSEFFESSGNAAASFNEQLRDGIVSHTCNMWAQYPKFFTKGTNPLSSFARGYMNQMCSPIQPAVPAPTPPFVGGQCCDKQYRVFVTYEWRRCAGDVVVGGGTDVPVIGTGRVVSVFLGPFPTNPNVRATYVTFESCTGNFSYVSVAGTTRQVSYDNCQTAPGNQLGEAINFQTSTNIITSVETVDGSPDDCGNLPPEYPDNEPGAGDLSTTIIINNLDGTDNTYNLKWNQINVSYNFPMSFKLNETNITLDLGGLTINGNPYVTDSNDNAPSPPPGSNGGKDENGDPYNTPDDEADYPIINPPILLDPIEDTIEYLVCEEGVLSPISETIKALPGLPAAVKIIVDILVNILEDLCEEQASEIGFPEVYPVLPGVERPAIVFYFKEFNGDQKLPSTYTSTVSNPSASAIASIPTVIVPDKSMGKYVVALKLNDGSRVSSTGIDEAAALAGYNFLLSQVEPSLIPANESVVRSVTFRDILQEQVVKCVQIEYYPNGKQQGVAPAQVRYIDPV